MARGPFAFAVLVLVALSATASSAFAGEPPASPEWCVRAEAPERLGERTGGERSAIDRSEKLSERATSLDDVVSFAVPTPGRPLADRECDIDLRRIEAFIRPKLGRELLPCRDALDGDDAAGGRAAQILRHQ